VNKPSSPRPVITVSTYNKAAAGLKLHMYVTAIYGSEMIIND